MSFLNNAKRRSAFLTSAAIAATAVSLTATPAEAVIINNRLTPTDARDPVNVNGIGQMFAPTNVGTGFGSCTGSLINPRMVLFAAHCVNSRPATAYGSLQGGFGVGFAFNNNTLPAAQSYIVAGPNRLRTNEAVLVYNSSQIMYHPASLEPASLGFQYGDVAIAALDTPTRNIPTWTMLFSPLPAPASINANSGTGYHVSITGYGNIGNPAVGQTPNSSDFRRRVAENMLGGLTSLDQRRDATNRVLGSPPGPADKPQPLYMIDFDDHTIPNGTRLDVFRDAALPREGITAQGDSGSPLILDQAFSKPIAIGVLSGGSWFPGLGQALGSYGSFAYYQPLFLYWDWIVANNPYRYVSATAGDGNWSDPTKWVTNLDPSYQILVGGQPTNGIPTAPGAANKATGPSFGQSCFNLPQFGVTGCRDVTTGAPVSGEGNAAATQTEQTAVAEAQGSPLPSTGDLTQALPGEGTLEVATQALPGQGNLDGEQQVAAVESAEPVAVATTASLADIAQTESAPMSATGFLPGPNAAPTLANGLPGATGFVPNNTDGQRVTASGTPIPARYFDVTLSNAGTITLDSTVTIDKLTIAGAQSQLNVATAGSLTSLIDITQFSGRTNVNGTLRTLGDYALIGGLLTGTGTIQTPFLTSVLGTVAPGGIGTIGTLTIQGNLILSSGSQTAIDLGANGLSDRVVVAAGSGQTGTANLGGALVLNPVTRATFGAEYTVLTAAGGRTGTFGSANALSAILVPVVTYTNNAVNVRINALSFNTVINSNSVVQSRFAALLDANRANGRYSQLSDLFGELDVLSAAGIRAAFENMAPRTEATNISLGLMSTDTIARFYRDRQAFLGTGNAGGTLALIGNPVQLAANAATADGTQTMSDTGSAGMVETRSVLPENVSAFLAGGYLQGEGAPFNGVVRDDLDGWYAAAGLEVEAIEGLRVGGGLHYVKTEGQAGALQSSEGELVQGTVYTNQNMGGFNVNTQLSVGVFSVDTLRVVPVGATTFQLRGDNRAFAFSGEVGAGYGFDLGGLSLTPNAALRYNLLDFGNARETGGGAALVTTGERVDSLQGRIGVDLGGNLGRGGTTIAPRLTAAYVHEFLDDTETVAVGFANSGFAGGAVPFLLPGRDNGWGEIGAGIRIGSDRFSIDLSADTTIERDDIEYQTYRAGVTIRF